MKNESDKFDLTKQEELVLKISFIDDFELGTFLER